MALSGIELGRFSGVMLNLTQPLFCRIYSGNSHKCPPSIDLPNLNSRHTIRTRYIPVHKNKRRTRYGLEEMYLLHILGNRQ